MAESLQMANPIGICVYTPVLILETHLDDYFDYKVI